MDWANEKYVRLFVRDTVTWKVLPWQSRALMPLLLRKLDRSGVLEFGDYGEKGIAILLDVPVDFVQAGLPALLKHQVFTMASGRLVMPNYIPAQETRQSDKQRQRDSRERRAKGEEPSEEPMTTGDVLSPPVTSGHQVSPPVTLTPSQTSLTPDQTERSSRARSNFPANDHGKPTARNVLTKFGAIRAELCGGKALFWQPSQQTVDKAAAWLSEMPLDAVVDLEPVIKAACIHIRDGDEGWTDKRLADPNFLFGSVVARWSALREELHNCAPTITQRNQHEQRPRTPIAD